MGTEQKQPLIKKKAVRIGAGAVLAFVTAVCLTVSGLCFVLLGTFSEGHMHASLNRVNYSESIVPYLEEELNELTIPSRLPEHYFTGKTDTGVLKTILDGSVHAHYAGEKFKPDTAALEAELSAGFLAYAESEQIKVSEEALSSLTALCVNQYIKCASPTAFSYLVSYAQKLIPYLRIAAIVCLVAAFGLGFYLLKIRMRLLFCCAAGGAGWMLFSVPLLLLLFRVVDGLGLSPEPVRLFAADYLRQPLIVLTVIGGILIAVAVVLAIVFTRAEGRKRPEPAPEKTSPENS